MAADDLQEKCAKCDKVVYEAEGLPAGKISPHTHLNKPSKKTM